MSLNDRAIASGQQKNFFKIEEEVRSLIFNELNGCQLILYVYKYTMLTIFVFHLDSPFDDERKVSDANDCLFKLKEAFSSYVLKDSQAVIIIPIR